MCLPALVAANTVHLCDGRGEEAGESAGDGPRAVEGTDADRQLTREVVRRGEVGSSREESGPGNLGLADEGVVSAWGNLKSPGRAKLTRTHPAGNDTGPAR